MAQKTISFVTNNPNKLAEVVGILGEVFTAKLQPVALDLPELQGSIDEISEKKCRQASSLIDGPVLTEDTALCFDALGGMPGPYVKWFLKAIGPEGLARLLAGFSDRSAVAVCTFAFCSGRGHPVRLFTGRQSGQIVDEPRGPRTFGWDPIFQPDGHTTTYAEMDKRLKNSMSHRAKALALVRQFLVSREGVDLFPREEDNCAVDECHEKRDAQAVGDGVHSLTKGEGIH